MSLVLFSQTAEAAVAWSKLVKYPQCLLPETRSTLDTLEEMISVPNSGDKYLDLSAWLDSGAKAGLITKTELFRIRNDLAPNL